MKIAMIASEANPLAKTGGLADVTYSLGKELILLGEEVAIVIPFYGNIKGTIKTNLEVLCEFDVNMSWRNNKAVIHRTYIDGIAYYLIANDQYFNRGHFYGDYDDGERFAFFTLACKKMFEVIDFKPDIIHIHDWQPGMLPCLIKEDKNNNFYKNTKFVMTIHNPAFQGMMPKSILGDLYNLSDELFDSGKVEFHGMVSTLKTGIMYSDKITTVSPTHRQELMSKEGSKGLDDIMWYKEHDFCGFLNGIDICEFNPRDDELIAKQYDGRNVKSAKKINKQELLKRFDLFDETAPLFVLVSRLTWQKGLDILIPTCYSLVNRGANIIVLGSGEYEAEQAFERLRGSYPKQVGIYIGYNDPLAHLIYAGGDFFLMPSLFEPCGIGQMIAQRYGTLPIVRRTGGLKDSVIGYDNYNLDTANGFGFDDYTYDALINTCTYALDVYNNNSSAFNKLIKNAMKVDNSWRKSAKLYLGLYKSVLEVKK